jgi:hypothetical protein
VPETKERIVTSVSNDDSLNLLSGGFGGGYGGYGLFN